MIADVATALLSMSTAATTDEAFGWAATALLRGANPDEVREAIRLWLAERDAAVQVVGR